MIADAALVIAAGGSGTRYGQGNKLFAPLRGIPLIVHSVRHLGPLFPPECRIMAIPAGAEKEFARVLENYAPEIPFRLIHGGATRTESVQNALAAIPDGVALAAIHDGARPLATPELLYQVLEAARRTGGAIPGRPVTDTLKKAGSDGLITGTVSRENLYAVETPQCFAVHLLREAYRRFPDSLTDDAGTMEAAGYPVEIVLAPAPNFKLTRQEDLEMLEKWLQISDIPGKTL